MKLSLFAALSLAAAAVDQGDVTRGEAVDWTSCRRGPHTSEMERNDRSYSANSGVTRRRVSDPTNNSGAEPLPKGNG